MFIPGHILAQFGVKPQRKSRGQRENHPVVMTIPIKWAHNAEGGAIKKFVKVSTVTAEKVKRVQMINPLKKHYRVTLSSGDMYICKKGKDGMLEAIL